MSDLIAIGYEDEATAEQRRPQNRRRHNRARTDSSSPSNHG